MAIFIVAFTLLIAIVVLTIKYFITYAKVASTHTYDKAAKKQAARLKLKDPVINCDYCGARIDTKVYNTCPQCGSTYNSDNEWINRYRPDKWVDENADKAADEEIARARAKAKKIAKKIRISIFILIGMFVFVVGGAILFDAMQEKYPGNYMETEEVNKYSTDQYKRAKYGFDEDAVIMDRDGIKVVADSIYYDSKHGRYKIGYKITNSTNKPLSVGFSRRFLNNVENSGYVGGMIRPNSSIITYSEIYEEVTGEIKTLSYTGLSIYTSGNDKIYNGAENDWVTITTNSEQEVQVTPPTENIIYDDDKILIAVKPLDMDKEPGSYYFYIYNKTDSNYYVNLSRDVIINGEKYNVYGIYDEWIPAGCMLNNIYAYTSGEDVPDIEDGSKLSFSFRCEDKPSLDFSTDYLELKR